MKPREAIRLLEKAGFVRQRQKGGHLIMIHFAKNKQVTIPIHNKPLKKGTLAAILRHAEISADEIRSLLK